VNASSRNMESSWNTKWSCGVVSSTDFWEALNKSLMHLFQTRGSGWKHKAWGGAKRNPRVTKLI